MIATLDPVAYAECSAPSDGAKGGQIVTIVFDSPHAPAIPLTTARTRYLIVPAGGVVSFSPLPDGVSVLSTHVLPESVVTWHSYESTYAGTFVMVSITDESVSFAALMDGASGDVYTVTALDAPDVPPAPVEYTVYVYLWPASVEPSS